MNAGTAAATSLLAAPAIVRAQGAALKVGVLLPRSGYQASIGQDCFRGVEITNPILKEIGLAADEIDALRTTSALIEPAREGC